MSTRVVGACSAACSSQSPRWICSSARRSPAMFKATRWPAQACCAGPVLRVQAAHPHRPSGVAEEQFVAHRDLSGEGRTGDHDAAAGDAEGPVHRQAEVSLAATLADFAGEPAECFAQRLDALPGAAGEREDRRARQRAEASRCSTWVRTCCPLRLDPVDLGQRHQRPADTEQFDDRQVLAGLRHQAVVGGHHQQHAIDAAGAGQHVVDEALVAGHVDEAGGAAVAKVGVEIAQVDGDPALALGRAAVALDAGEGAQQRGLAVVDVPGGADDHDSSLRSRGSWARNAGSSSSWRRSSQRASSSSRPITGSGSPRRASSRLRRARPRRRLGCPRTQAQRGAGQPRHRLRAAADHAQGVDHSDLPALAERLAQRRRQTLGLGADLRRRAAEQAQGGQAFGEAVRIAVQAEHRLEGGEVSLSTRRARQAGSS